jgi:hypothetical protein
MEEELCRIECPTDYNKDRLGTHNAYHKLLNMVHEYVYDCLRNELAFPCKVSDCASCVVLGTVEVTNGCITHVCNSHRRYVWSFANLFEVLLYELLEVRQEAAGQKGCCPERPIDMDFFLKMFHHDRWAGQKSAQSVMSAARQVRNNMRQVFDYTEERVMSPSVLLRRSFDEATDIGKALGMNVTKVDASGIFLGHDPIAASLAHFLQPSGRSNRIYAVVDDNDHVVAAIPEFGAPAAEFEAAVATTADMHQRLDDMTAEIARLREQLPKMKPDQQAQEPKTPEEPKA